MNFFFIIYFFFECLNYIIEKIVVSVMCIELLINSCVVFSYFFEIIIRWWIVYGEVEDVINYLYKGCKNFYC